MTGTWTPANREPAPTGRPGMNGKTEHGMYGFIGCLRREGFLEKIKCSRCGELKTIDEFYVKRASKKGHCSQCKICCAFVRRKNSHLRRPLVNERQRQWRMRNYDRLRAIEVERDLKRRNTPLGKIKNHMLARIWQSLNGSMGGQRWVNLVGYTAEELKKHLEKQFTKEMSWENHGTYWEIDHIKPIANFNFKTPKDDDFKKCWALTNLQPLTRSENRRKCNRA